MQRAEQRRAAASSEQWRAGERRESRESRERRAERREGAERERARRRGAQSARRESARRAAESARRESAGSTGSAENAESAERAEGQPGAAGAQPREPACAAQRARAREQVCQGQWVELMEGARNFVKISGEPDGRWRIEKARPQCVSLRETRAGVTTQQELVGASLAPKTLETLAELQNRKPQEQVCKIPADVLASNPTPVDLDVATFTRCLASAPSGSAPGPGSALTRCSNCVWMTPKRPICSSVPQKIWHEPRHQSPLPQPSWVRR